MDPWSGPHKDSLVSKTGTSAPSLFLSKLCIKYEEIPRLHMLVCLADRDERRSQLTLFIKKSVPGSKHVLEQAGSANTVFTFRID